MAKYRLEFSKEGDAKFVSHLDLVRLFTRVFKRAGLPLAYSEGFNPHPKMSIGIPLSVGVTSEAELLDAEFYEEVPALEIKARMNETMPIGIAITKVQKLEQGMPKLSSVSRASYRISLSGDGVAKEALSEFLQRETIEIEKKTKRSEKLVDIKPDIFGIDWEDETTLVMTLATGSAANLKPEVVLSAMKLYIPGCSGEAETVHRLAMTDDNGCALIAG